MQWSSSFVQQLLSVDWPVAAQRYQGMRGFRFQSDGSASDSNEGERVSSPGEGPSGASEDEASPGSDGHDSEQ